MKHLLIFLTFIFAVSCSTNKSNKIQAEFSKMKSTEECITESQDFQRYFTISKELLSEIAESDMTETEMLSFVSNSNYDTILSRINASAADIIRYDSIPIYCQRIADTTSTSDCSFCSLSQQEIAGEYVSLIGWIRSEPEDFDDFIMPCVGSGTTCKWVQYLSCLAGCCLLPPIINAMCCVACYCDYCTREEGHPMNKPCGQTSTN